MIDLLPILFACVFWAFIIVCLWFIVCRSVYLLSKHWEYRLELFRLRDELRNLSIQTEKRLDPKIFHYTQSGMNSMLKMIPFLDIRLLKRALKAIHEDDALRKRIEERIQILNECDIPEFREIQNQTFRLQARILFLNSTAQNPFPFLFAVVREVLKTFTFSLRNIRDKFVNRQTKNKSDELCVIHERDWGKLAQIAGLGNIV